MNHSLQSTVFSVAAMAAMIICWHRQDVAAVVALAALLITRAIWDLADEIRTTRRDT